MARALTVCNRRGCTARIPQGQGRCAACQAQADRERRPDGNPYASKGHRYFRRRVLDRDPICALCHLRVATIADHFPYERKQLIDMGLNPNDPQYGRGLCATCHARHTAATSPGGWAAQSNSGR